MKQIAVRFAWSCGGLDAAAQTLADLEPSEVPDADQPLDTRGYLEKMGYKTRHKYNKQEFQILNKKNEHSPINKNRQKHKTKTTIGKQKRLVASAHSKSDLGHPKWFTLSGDQFTKLYHRHRDMIMAHNEQLYLAKHAEANGLQPVQKDAPEVGVFWWHDESGGSKLSDNNELGLASAHGVAGLRCVLYSYKCPDNLPSGVMWNDARIVLSEDDYETYKERGWTVTLLAAYGRLLAMERELSTGAKFVWFVDLDMHWFQDAKTACSQMPAVAFGHVCATVQRARAVASSAGIIRTLRNKMFDFLRIPGDNLLFAPPSRVTNRSKLVRNLLDSFGTKIRRDACESPGYYCFAQECQTQVARCGLLGAYMNPMAFNSVPPSTGLKCLGGLGQCDVKLTYDLVCRNAIGVNASWQSAELSRESYAERGSHSRVLAGA